MLELHVTVTKIDGSKVGEYTTGKDGSVLVDKLETGWYIVTETKAPDGYTLPETVEQRVEIKSGAQATVTFQHKQVFGLQIITTCRQTKEKVPAPFTRSRSWMAPPLAPTPAMTPESRSPSWNPAGTPSLLFPFPMA